MTDLPTTDPSAVLELHKLMIDRLKDRPEAVALLDGDCGSIRIVLRNPGIALSLVLDGKNTRLEQITSDNGEWDTTVSMPWKTAHEFWSGRLDLMGAIMDGSIKIDGKNLDPLFRLKALLRPAQQIYLDLVAESGEN